MIIYISIGNSDDKLSQAEWASYLRLTSQLLRHFDDVHIHGYWLSSPESPYQNACWCVDFSDTETDVVDVIKEDLQLLAGRFRQDSIAWAEAPVTTFLKPYSPKE